MIVIDTSVAVNFLRGEKGSVSAVRSALAEKEIVGVSALSLFELLHPIYHRKLEKQGRAVKSFISQTKLLSLDGSGAEESAKIMGSLLRIGEAVNALDVLIAGTALANGARKLLSADRDYEKISKVSDLKIELVEK